MTDNSIGNDKAAESRRIFRAAVRSTANVTVSRSGLHVFTEVKPILSAIGRRVKGILQLAPRIFDSFEE